MKPVILAALFLALPAFARLGETEKELVARYGAPTLSSAGNIYFSKAEFEVMAAMIDGKCESILYLHRGGDLPDQRQSGFIVAVSAEMLGGGWDAIFLKIKKSNPLDKTMSDALLDANKGELGWGESSVTRRGTMWFHQDQGTTAYLPNDKPALLISSAKYRRAAEAKEKAAEQAKKDALKGF